jgi:hypothetical protein
MSKLKSRFNFMRRLVKVYKMNYNWEAVTNSVCAFSKITQRISIKFYITVYNKRCWENLMLVCTSQI